VPLQPVSPLKLQVETDLGWSQEEPSIVVPEGRLFRTWVGVTQSTPEKDFLTRHVEKRLGKLQLAMKISAADVKLDVEL